MKGLKLCSSTCEGHIQPLTQSPHPLTRAIVTPATDCSKTQVSYGENKLWKGNNENQAKQERGSEKDTPQGIAKSLVDGPQSTDVES